MTNVFYFSGSGHSMAVAKEMSRLLQCEPVQIGRKTPGRPADTAVVIFPVYCENIPSPVKDFLRRLKAKQAVLIATYGKISYGNVLYEAQQLVNCQVIAGAYIPIGHTFLNGNCDFDTAPLQKILQRIQDPKPILLPKLPKNPLSDLLPGLRSRIGTKIVKNSRCDMCGLCEENCPTAAIRNGRVTSSCIRCLQCLTLCPKDALEFRNLRILEWYLHREQKNDFILYL